MKLVSINTPQSEKDLAMWMEQMIVSPDFAQWLAELAAVRNVDSPSTHVLDFEAFLNERFAQISDYGLMSLSREQMCLLLANPEHLLKLQKHIYLNESPYWTNLFKKQASTPESERERTNVALLLGPEAVVLARQGQNHSEKNASGLFRPYSLLIFAVALVVLTLAGYWLVTYLRHQQAINAQWNWQTQLQSLPIHSPKEYFQTLAQQADDWYHARPTSLSQLRTRLEKLKNNLSELATSNQSSLKDVDRKWLEQTSKAWIAKCDTILKSDDFDSAMKDADALCEQIINELYQRSDSFNR